MMMLMIVTMVRSCTMRGPVFANGDEQDTCDEGPVDADEDRM